MAEDPAFSGFSNGSAIEAAAAAVSGIRSDMSAIEASARNIERSLSRASKTSPGSGFGAQNAGGGTGFSKDQGMSLGQITSQLGGVGSVARVGAFGVGALAGGVGGGIAAAAFGDLRVSAERAMTYEAARFGASRATGDFANFRGMIDIARNDFNVQNEAAFLQTVQYGTQRLGMAGIMGGGTVGANRAAQAIGSFNTLAGMAGIDQSMVGGAMQSMYGAQSYYASMAAGIQTRNPATGELLSPESVINQMWGQSGIGGMDKERALQQIDIDFGIGGMGRAQLEEMFGQGSPMVDMVVEGLRMRAQNNGQALKEGAMQDQAKESGQRGNKWTQAMDSQRSAESAQLDLVGEYVNDVTAGIEEAYKHIESAVEYMAEAEGLLRDIIGGLMTIGAQMDVFKTELPGATEGITGFFSGLPGLFASALGGGLGGALGAGGKAGGLARTVGLLSRVPVVGWAAAAGVTALAGGVYAWDRWIRDSPEEEARKVREGTSAAQSQQRSAETARKEAASSGNDLEKWIANSGSGTVGVPQYSKGEWFVESDQIAKVHYGEMVVPKQIATAVREELAMGKVSSQASSKRGQPPNVNIYLSVQRATDQEAIELAHKVKRILDGDRELMGIGLGRL